MTSLFPTYTHTSSQASLDEPTQMIVVHHAKPNQLQSKALLLAEKVN